MKASMMRIMIPIVMLAGMVVLFFFPEPQTNFLWYFLTALFFLSVVVYLIVRVRKK